MNRRHDSVTGCERELVKLTRRPAARPKNRPARKRSGLILRTKSLLHSRARSRSVSEVSGTKTISSAPKKKKKKQQLINGAMAFGSASPNRSKAQGPWLLVLLFSAFVLSLLAFHYRWDRPITTSPIKLPKISYRFVQHPDLLHFDQATQSRWNSIINEDWWNMKWKDESSGQVVTRGVDMLHKLHCLIALREEFTMLVNDPSRHLKFQAEDVGSTDMRLHLGHCFDFLRQVRTS